MDANMSDASSDREGRSTLKWRRTVISAGDAVPDDWSLQEPGRSIARLYKVRGGPHDGAWAWFVQVAPDGTPRNGGAGFAATGREAKEECERRLPEEILARLVRPEK